MDFLDLVGLRDATSAMVPSSVLAFTDGRSLFSRLDLRSIGPAAWDRHHSSFTSGSGDWQDCSQVEQAARDPPTVLEWDRTGIFGHSTFIRWDYITGAEW